jgi:ATP-dependent Zn protease
VDLLINEWKVIDTYYRDHADMSDFEYARDRIMMGIERRKLSISDKERLNTAIHEAGHAIACYFSKGAKKLYKATIVARGGSLGAVSTMKPFTS